MWQIHLRKKKKKSVQPSGNNDKTSLGKVLFPPCNYRTEAPVEVLDTPFHAHRKTSAKQFLANYNNNSRHFWQGFFSSLNLELLKSSQIVEVEKEQKQMKNLTKRKQLQVKLSETKQNIQCNGK